MIANEHAKLTGTPVGTNAMRAFIETTLFLHSAFYEPRTGLPVRFKVRGAVPHGRACQAQDEAQPRASAFAPARRARPPAYY
jgi:hypothetical protein